MEKQTTLARAVQYTDIGLHSGQPVSLELKPAPADTGIVFIRADLADKPAVRANAGPVTSTLRATSGCTTPPSPATGSPPARSRTG